MDLKLLAKQLRLSALKMALECGKNGSHLGSAMSSMEIYAALYGKVLNVDSEQPLDENRDRMVIGKGHSVLAYYSALRYAGFVSDDDLASFETNGSHFHGHAMRNLYNGIEFSGGSLSMGMSFAVGQAIACKKKDLSSRVFVLIGDGECDEGLIWEAAMSASNYHLDNFVVIVDKNVLQYDGPTAEIMDLVNLGDKFKSFGFNVIEVDGHNPDKIAEVLKVRYDAPLCLIAHTIKGKGVSFMENQKEWHHHTLSKEQYDEAVKEVNNV